MDDATRKFQEKWVLKLPWEKLSIREDETLHIVKCKA
jgi:hypothetical protein